MYLNWTKSCMKYSDKQRIQKIYENAEKLQNYIKEHGVTILIGISISEIEGFDALMKHS